MKTGFPVHPSRLGLSGVLLCLLLVGSPGALHAGNDAGGEIQGRIVCLDASGEIVAECSETSRRFALRSGEDRIFRFLESDPIAEMFTDPRVRDRELRIRVWHREENRVEIVKVYSIRNGLLHDLHYYCDVCHITSFVGGPCWCCQMDFEFREEPVS